MDQLVMWRTNNASLSPLNSDWDVQNNLRMVYLALQRGQKSGGNNNTVKITARVELETTGVIISPRKIRVEYVLYFSEW